MRHSAQPSVVRPVVSARAKPPHLQEKAEYPRQHSDLRSNDLEVRCRACTCRKYGQRASGPFWYAKWSRDGTPVVRALGRAWVEQDEGERCRRGLTFRELGHEGLYFLQYEKGAKPSTLSG
jgi:hypothetical protein